MQHLSVCFPLRLRPDARLLAVACRCAVLIVLSVGAGNDWKKDQQFRKLNAAKDLIKVKVLRGGSTQLVLNTQVVVGDVYLLDTGDKIVAGEQSC